MRKQGRRSVRWGAPWQRRVPAEPVDPPLQGSAPVEETYLQEPLVPFALIRKALEQLGCPLAHSGETVFRQGTWHRSNRSLRVPWTWIQIQAPPLTCSVPWDKQRSDLRPQFLHLKNPRIILGRLDYALPCARAYEKGSVAWERRKPDARSGILRLGELTLQEAEE